MSFGRILPLYIMPRTQLLFLMRKNIRFVAKGDNPQNVPQLRPVENLWEF